MDNCSQCEDYQNNITSILTKYEGTKDKDTFMSALIEQVLLDAHKRVWHG